MLVHEIIVQVVNGLLNILKSSLKMEELEEKKETSVFDGNRI